MSIAWSETLASGSAEIDRQHKELFERINDLLAALKKGGVDMAEVARIVAYLTEYVVFHFGTEEKLMDQYAYSSASGHKAQHAQFIKVFQRLKDRMMKEGLNPPLQQETKELVVDWLLNHIKYSDRALGAYLKLKNQPFSGHRSPERQDPPRRIVV
jgi:hemerythrin